MLIDTHPPATCSAEAVQRLVTVLSLPLSNPEPKRNHNKYTFILAIIIMPQQSWRNQVTDFMKSRYMEEDMAEDRHLWRLGVEGRLLAV